MEERLQQRSEEPRAQRSALFAGGPSPLIARAAAMFREIDARIDRQLRTDALRQQRYRRQLSGE
jgi:hypothetical protein